jgi:hypothetical protein
MMFPRKADGKERTLTIVSAAAVIGIVLGIMILLQNPQFQASLLDLAGR